MTETLATLYKEAERLQTEAKELQAKATNLYKIAGGIKQLAVNIATKNTPEITKK